MKDTERYRKILYFFPAHNIWRYYISFLLTTFLLRCQSQIPVQASVRGVLSPGELSAIHSYWRMSLFPWVPFGSLYGVVFLFHFYLSICLSIYLSIYLDIYLLMEECIFVLITLLSHSCLSLSSHLFPYINLCLSNFSPSTRRQRGRKCSKMTTKWAKTQGHNKLVIYKDASGIHFTFLHCVIMIWATILVPARNT